MGRLIPLLAVLVLLGGLGAAYVWRVVNALAQGEASAWLVASALLVAVGLVGLLTWLLRYVDQLDPDH